MRRRTCPSCGEDISSRFVPGRHSYCPACGVGLAFRQGPFRALPLFAFVIVGLSLYAFGLRDLQLMAVSYLLGHPAWYVMALITARLFPPELETTGDVRGILHPVEPVRRAVEPIDTAVSSSQESAVRAFQGHRPAAEPRGLGAACGWHPVSGGRRLVRDRAAGLHAPANARLDDARPARVSDYGKRAARRDRLHERVWRAVDMRCHALGSTGHMRSSISGRDPRGAWSSCGSSTRMALNWTSSAVT